MADGFVLDDDEGPKPVEIDERTAYDLDRLARRGENREDVVERLAKRAANQSWIWPAIVAMWIIETIFIIYLYWFRS